MNPIATKDKLIQDLEGKVIDTGFGRRLVSRGQFHLVNGKFTSLENYTVHQLRFWLKHALPGPQEREHATV